MPTTCDQPPACNPPSHLNRISLASHSHPHVHATSQVAEIKKAVSTNFLLGHLSDSQKEEVFGSMQQCLCSAGDKVIETGQPGDWFYVVHSGTYDAYIDGTLIRS